MDLFDVRGAAIVGDTEIADRSCTQRRQCRHALQRFGSGNVRITDLEYPVGIARQCGRSPDKHRQPYRTEPPGVSQVYVSHVGSRYLGSDQNVVVRRTIQLRVGGRVRKSDVLKFAPGVELISGSKPVYFVQV